MRFIARLVCPLTLLGALACGGAPPPDPAPPVKSEPQPGLEAAEVPAPIDVLAEDYWGELMRVSPTWASYRGDRSRDAELPDLSAEARATHDAALSAFAERARAIDPAPLSERQRLVRDTLLERLTLHFEDREACGRHAWVVDQLGGPQSWLGELPAYHVVDGAQRARDLVARYRALPRLFDQHVTNLRGGLKAGRTAARINVTRTIAQLDRMLKTPLDEDPFLARPLAQAAKLDAPPYPAFDAEIRAAVEGPVRTALTRYRDFLVAGILPASRTAPGIAGLPGGAACYRASIRRHTGLDLDPEAIHRVGLDEVARIRAAMKAVAAELGHPSVDAALAALADDPAQRRETGEALLQYNAALLDRARAALPRAFGRLPKTPIEPKAIEAFRAPDVPAGYYYSAPEDGSRPAYYYLNTHAPETRPLYTMPALAWHEAIPGHHLQIALAREAEALPTFMQSTGFTAFTEGWALYAEQLADELGLYHTPAERLGAYTYEIWRAARLVVDTGLHHLGWTRQQAIDYLQAQTGHPPGEVINEIDRYIVWPGQALAYKLGQLEISKLRAEAEAALGARFDLKAWHDRLLRDGAIPLTVLRAQMTGWVAERAATAP